MTATAPRTKVTRLITEPTLGELVVRLQGAETELKTALDYAALKRARLNEIRQMVRHRMESEGIDAFSDQVTGTHIVIATQRRHEIVDMDRVFAALHMRGRTAECTRLDVRAVKREARSAPLDGTTEVTTRRLRVRRVKGA